MDTRAYLIRCLIVLLCAVCIRGMRSYDSTVTLVASPDYISVIENVTVSWKGVAEPYETDFVAVFLQGSSTNLTYAFVNGSDTWEQGYGSLNFNLLNMRQNYTFSYVSNPGNKNNYNVLATSNLVGVNVNQPMQGHISLTENTGEIRVMWVSGTDSNPTVQYGRSSGHYTETVSATTTTYSVNDLCGNTTGGNAAALFFLDPGYIHNAVITDLEPDRTYYYTFGTDNAWSPEYQFKGPISQPREGGIRLFAFGDSGVSICENMGWDINPNLTGWCEPASGETTNGIISDMQRMDYDLVLHIGDISYAVGYAVRWEQFFQQIQPIATQIPYMVAIGNHEFDYIGQPFNPIWANYSHDSHGECGVPFDSRFVMPANGEGDLWFSIDYPLLHVVVISTEHDFTEGSEQWQWIEQDLASVNRSEKWLVLTGHRPMYTSNYFYQDWSIGAKMRENLEPLMMKYGVDVAFWGHVHNYERMCPVYNKTCYGNLDNPRAPVHFIIGMAGQIFDDEWVSPQPEWSMFRASDYGYTRIHIPDTSSFHIEYVGDKDGGIHDDVWIYRNPNKLTHWE